MGNLGATEDSEKVSRIFDQLFFIGYWIYGFAGICLFELLNPFVELAFGKQYLFQREVVLVLCINFFVNGTRKAVLIFKESMGLFWYDRYKAIAEAVLNLGISILLVTHFGVVGVFAGTFCSTVLTSVWVEPYIIYRYRFQKPVRKYFGRYSLYLIVMAVAWAVTEFCCQIVNGSAVFNLFYRLLVCLIIPNGLLYLFYRKTKEYQEVLLLAKSVIQKLSVKMRK